MDRQLITILKKRYILLLVLAILAILGTYTLSGINSARDWKLMYESLNSKEHLATLKKDQNDFFYEEKYQNLTFDEKIKLYQEDNLNIINYNYDAVENTSPKNGKDFYSSFFFKEAFLPLSILAGAVGFLLFFVDLKASFNTFLFSLGISKRKIYWYKHVLISVPFLASILLGKFILTGIILANIPQQFINISPAEMLSSIIGSWVTLFFYFFSGSFIGLVTGNLVLGPLTVLGFSLSLNTFAISLTNGWNYLVGNHSDPYVHYQGNFFYELGQNKVDWFHVAIVMLGILLILLMGSYLYPKLSLEKNGHYLLVDSLRLPVLLSFIFYSTILLTFSSGIYNYALASPNMASPLPTLIISFIVSACIGGYTIYHNHIHTFIYKRFILKNRLFY